MLPFSVYIAKRYLFTRSNKSAVNIISFIAFIAVVVASLSLFIVLSGFSGLKNFAVQFSSVVDSDLKIFPENGKTIYLSPEIENNLLKIEGVETLSKVIEEKVFIQYKGKNQVAYIKGVDNNYKNVTPIDSLLYIGKWFNEGLDEAVIGFGIASKLAIPVNDYGNLIELYVPKPGTGQVNLIDPSSAFSQKKVVASGIYEINDELNYKYIFTELDLARNLLQLDSITFSSLEIKINTTAKEATIIKNIENTFLKQQVVIKNRFQQNDALYKMLNTENLFTYLFVSLIAAIAIFNITGTLIMIILEKRNNLKTLYSMGLTIEELRRIFFYNGLMLTIFGTFVGLTLGTIIVALQLRYGFVPITPTLAYPVAFSVLNFVMVIVTIIFLGGIASKLASLRVSKALLR